MKNIAPPLVPPPPRVFLQTLGCRLNEAESASWGREFQRRGWQWSASPEQATLLVINSCAVTAEAARKSRQLLRRARRRNPRARIVMTGCYATLENSAKVLGEADLVLPNVHKDQLVARVLKEWDWEAPPATTVVPATCAPLPRKRCRAFIKVQDGCRHRCTFCTVTVARGEERSRSPAQIVREVLELEAAGVKEVVLSGVHLGGYGASLGTNLERLLRHLLDKTRIPRIRLGSLEPWELPPGLLELFSGEQRLMPHLHLPLQSGSDALLKRMARRCRSTDFAALLERARAKIPELAVSTDVIVGFPGESAAHWRESLRFIESMGFSGIHVFPYSARPGTPAANFPDPVTATERKARCQQLLALARRLRAAFLARYEDCVLPVLWEQQREASSREYTESLGYTPNYLPARARGWQPPTGEIQPVRLAKAAQAEVLLATPVSSEFIGA